MSESPTFFADPISEKLFGVLVALAAEVTVLRDRVAHLEAARPEGAPPRPPYDAAREAERFVQDVFGGLAKL